MSAFCFREILISNKRKEKKKKQIKINGSERNRRARNRSDSDSPVKKSGRGEWPPDDGGPNSTGNFSFSRTGGRYFQVRPFVPFRTYIHARVCVCVCTWPCKKVWKQKLPWPLGFYGDWSDRTGARSLRVYTRVRGSIIPPAVCMAGNMACRRVSGAKKSKRARSVCNAKLPPATTKGRNVADSWTNERPEIFRPQRRENGVVPTFLSSTVCFLRVLPFGRHTHMHAHRSTTCLARCFSLLSALSLRSTTVSITLKTFDSIM